MVSSSLRLGLSARWAILAAALLCLLPLLVTPVVPSIDLYAHMMRFDVLANAAEEPAITESYRPVWSLLPNLGMDVLGTAVMEAVPPLLGAKILTGIIILAPFAGALAFAWALQGRIGPLNLALAGLLSFSYILSWGFANFLLGLGLALGGLAAWVALRDRPGWQLAVGVALGVLIMFVHGLVFALWGLILATLEASLAWERRRGARLVGEIAWRGARLLLLAALPALIFLNTRTSGAEEGVTAAIGNLVVHIDRGAGLERVVEEVNRRFENALRVADLSWPWVSRLLGLVLWGALLAGALTGALRLDRRLWPAVGVLVVLVGLTPPNMFGVGHLDDRIPLVLLATIAAGVSVAPGGRPRWLPALVVLLFPVHLALVTLGWARQGEEYRRYLDAVRRVETGNLAVASFLGGTGERDASVACKPLLFLLFIENRTAVPTFANPTQQPLAIQGPLEAAQEASRMLPEGSEAERLRGLLDAGYDTVVTCGPLPADLGAAGLASVAEGDGWALVQRMGAT